MQDANIKAAVMFGTGKFQPGILILPPGQYHSTVNDAKALTEYRNLIWDTVSRVNKMAPQHSRIFKELIILSEPDKPFEFTAKGTPKRQIVLKKYEDNIERAYTAYDEVALVDVPTILSSNFEVIIHAVRTMVHKTLETSIGDQHDMFQAGADSLCAVSIRNTIISCLRQAEGIPVAQIHRIPYDFVYRFPSISAIAAFIFGWNLANGIESRDAASEIVVDVPRGIRPKPFSREFSDEIVVELQDGKYPPLIFFPGLAGTPKPMALMPPISTALWGIQMTAECPKDSLEVLAEFFVRKIKEKQPSGPYRLAAYSGTSVILVCVVKALESKGDEVVEFVMVDHFPILFLNGVDPRDSPVKSEDRWKEYYRKTLGNISNRLITATVERGTWSPKRLGEELRIFLNGGAETERVKGFNMNAPVILRTALKFLLSKQFWKMENREESWSEKLLFDWMGDVRAPFTIYIAKDGFQHSQLGSKGDLRAREVYPNAKVVHIEGDHITCIWNTGFTKRLSEGF